MSLLHLHTELLELMDWDDEVVDEATRRTVALAKEISSDGQEVNVSELKKRLREEYTEDVTNSLLRFFEVASRFEEELKKHMEEEGDDA
jgi:light-regulated signal transduction histidine kinase (bacteriophytochrome)